MKQVKKDETFAELSERTALAGGVAWMMVSGITAMCYREKGEDTLVQIWRRLLSSEQKERFIEALDKLEIKDNPPAVTAALYHYHSNSIGGLNMQIVVESDRKAWIRYMAPWGSYPGIAALAVPPAVRRTILSTWHPRNGELLDCPRLGWVATKFVADGHPYDEGYFYEYDHDLSPEERFCVEHVETSPEFDPETAPKLNPELWSEARVLKGGYNYSTDYVRHVVSILYELLGVHSASYVISMAMRMLGAQFSGDLAAKTGCEDNDPESIVKLFATIFTAFRNDVSVETGETSATVVLDGLVPFTDQPDPALREAVFEFAKMVVRQRNGHCSITREFDETTCIERWTVTDEGKWLW